MIDDFGENIPFEELDDCCQKEVLQNRRNKEVTASLRTSDRSNIRLDMQSSVLFNKKKCECCSSSKDYELLSRLRKDALSCLPCVVDEVQDEFDSESDDDELLDSFVSPEEEQRKLEFAEKQMNLNNAQSFGLGYHLEDSVQHITSDVAGGMIVIAHVYNSNEILCAKLDLALEDISTKYIGAKFRRVPYSEMLFNNNFLGSYGVSSGNVTKRGSLLCFRNKTLCGSVSLTELSFEDTLYIEEVTKFLDNAGVLSTDIPLEALTNMSAEGRRAPGIDSDEEEEDGAQAYCDDPDCTKRYIHEHIGQPMKAASFLLEQQTTTGMEALGRNFLTQL